MLIHPNPESPSRLHCTQGRDRRWGVILGRGLGMDKGLTSASLGEEAVGAGLARKVGTVLAAAVSSVVANGHRWLFKLQ